MALIKNVLVLGMVVGSGLYALSCEDYLMTSTHEGIFWGREKHPGRQAALLPLQKLKEIIEKSKDAEALADDLYTNGGREVLFRLQALSRIFRKFPNGEKFQDLLYLIKPVEDLLGKIDYYDSFAKIVETKNGPRQIIKNLRSQQKKERQYLIAVLEKARWVSVSEKSPLFERLLEIVRKDSWPSSDEYRDQVRDVLHDEVKDLKKDLQNGKFDLTNLEEGVHEVRRKLRWISIYFGALNGLVQLRENTELDGRYSELLDPKARNSSFNRLRSNPAIESPIIISAPILYVLSTVISRIGSIKDDAQMKEALIEASDGKAEGISELLKAWRVPEVAFDKETKKLIDALIKLNVLGDLQKELKEAGRTDIP